MPILLVVILFACAIGIVIALLTLSIQRISRRVIEQYRDRLDDANTIVNQGRPPDSWVQPFRERIGAAKAGREGTGVKRERESSLPTSRGFSPLHFLTHRSARSVEQVGEQARGQCLKRLKRLISFMEKGQFYDDDETREIVVKTLRVEYDRWTSCHWSELVRSEEGEGRAD